MSEYLESRGPVRGAIQYVTLSATGSNVDLNAWEDRLVRIYTDIVVGIAFAATSAATVDFTATSGATVPSRLPAGSTTVMRVPNGFPFLQWDAGGAGIMTIALV